MFTVDIAVGVFLEPPGKAGVDSGPLLEVLVVEDDEADAFLIKRLLAAHPRIGNVIRAVDGVDALEMLGMGVHPDLAFIDINMPRMSGVALVAEMGLRRLHFPMVVLTSAKSISDSTRRRLRRADKVVSKPDSIAGFGNVLNAAIDALAA